MEDRDVVARAKIVYFFKETFRAHSKAEYREVLSRGLGEDNGGITGAFPWLYVRAFLALFFLFTINVLVLRFTSNSLYVPSVTFLGGVTFTVPFIILLYELYPKRDIGLLIIFAALVGGGTFASVLSQLCYSFINVENEWVSAVAAGLIEEVCKAIPAMVAIILIKQKNPYACFLIAAAVGGGFSVLEDMGYIFYYSDKVFLFRTSNIEATVTLFVTRGLSSLCTHVLWTGAVGWAYCIFKRPFKSVSLLVLASSVVIHICWDLPLEGWLQIVDIALCVIVAAAINIAIVHVSRTRTLYAEVDLTRMNEAIIREAREMGERMRFTNAASLTFSLSMALLSVFALLLCSLPIGVEYKSEFYEDCDKFSEYVEGGYNLTADWDREYDPNGDNVELRYIEGELSYVIQKDKISGYDGEYFYGYYISGSSAEIASIAVELDEIPFRINCEEYSFGDEKRYLFEVNAQELIDYTYNKDGTVTALTEAEEFTGYNFLIGLCAAAVATAGSCTVVLVGLGIKLRRLKNEIE